MTVKTKVVKQFLGALNKGVDLLIGQEVGNDQISRGPACWRICHLLNREHTLAHKTGRRNKIVNKYRYELIGFDSHF
jgi:hypothetical protein